MDMFPIILTIHLLLAIGLVGVVLLQRSEGGALGIGGGGGGGGVLTGRAAGNLLTRTTAVLAAAFFVTSLSLAIIANSHNKVTETPFDKLPAQNSVFVGSAPRGSSANCAGGSARPLIKGFCLWVSLDHDAVHFYHRWRGLFAGQGVGVRCPGRLPASARVQGPSAQARSLSQRRSGHHEPVSARRGLRHR